MCGVFFGSLGRMKLNFLLAAKQKCKRCPKKRALSSRFYTIVAIVVPIFFYITSPLPSYCQSARTGKEASTNSATRKR